MHLHIFTELQEITINPLHPTMVTSVPVKSVRTVPAHGALAVRGRGLLEMPSLLENPTEETLQKYTIASEWAPDLGESAGEPRAVSEPPRGVSLRAGRSWAEVSGGRVRLLVLLCWKRAGSVQLVAC